MFIVGICSLILLTVGQKQPNVPTMLAAFLSKVEFFRRKYLVARERRIGCIRVLNQNFWTDQGEFKFSQSNQIATEKLTGMRFGGATSPT
jgi:hypothetical protein